MAKKSSNTQKTSKSSSQKKKEVGGFILGTVAAAAVATKSASRGKSKKQKASIKSLAFILVLAIIVCGVLFYMDVAPFNFEINGDMFKYYSYTPIRPSNNLVGLDVDDFRFHVIDVNQGDCLLLELPDGKNMLIDGAKKSNTIATGILDYLLSDQVGLKDENGIVTIDYMLLTHADADHCGSLDDIIKSDKVNVLNMYRPMIMSKYANDPLKEYVSQNNYSYSTISTTVYSQFVEAVYMEEGCNTFYNIGDIHLSGSGYDIYFFNPTYDMYQNISTAADKNNVSPIIILDVCGRKIALTGDADAEQEENFISQLSNNNYGIDASFADVDVLKVAHHGGQESSTNPFLSVVKPEYAFISVGEGNSYGHPRPEVLSRLNDVGCNAIYRTDIVGSIVLTISSETEEISIDVTNPTQTTARGISGVLRARYNNILTLVLTQRVAI